MSDYKEKIEQLQQRLDKMVEYQGYFDKEINLIRSEIKLLRAVAQKSDVIQPSVAVEIPRKVFVPPPNSASNNPKIEEEVPPITSPNFTNTYANNFTQKDKNNLEKFIGENLISKIGIVILIIGVGIGAKYAIDNNLISPLARIFFGYLIGFGLLGFAVKLKPQYLNFSAVLLSGGMAIMYFITYFAYSYYNLISQLSAFSVMVIFTIFTVLAAIIYNQVVIAQIGLVGAYAVPFLLSEKSGRIEILLSYIALINVGILALSVKKYWKSLFYSSFFLTWLIYVGWFASKYQDSQHFTLAFTFLSIFFAIFYCTFLAYKLLNHHTLTSENIFFILTNSFIFFSLGSSILDKNTFWKDYLGLFTIFNAFIHFGIGYLIKHFRLGDKTSFYLTVILVLSFTTIAFPIQTKGNWTTLFWTAEAAALFWIGRTKRISLFENYSYPLMLLASIALFGEWMNKAGKSYTLETASYPFFNKYFVVGIFFVLLFGFINFINRDKNYESSLPKDLVEISKYALAGIFLLALYNVFRLEIGNYFYWQELSTAVKPTTENIYNPFDTVTNPAIAPQHLIWQLNYTMLFLALLSWANIKYFKDSILGFANLALNAFITLLFLSIGLYLLSDLRDLYVQNDSQYSQFFQFGTWHIIIRYLSIPFVLLLFWTSYNYIKQEFITQFIPYNLLSTIFDISLSFAIWILLSSELLNWMDIFGVQDSYKLGLSILWGIYALTLIILGIYWRKTHLRISAIVLFSLTLIKVFLYDLSELGTISKTIVFVALGILLLIISFLYNKYKGLIFEEDKSTLNHS